MAEMAFVCLYFSYLETLIPFTDEERGRIVMAMMNYAANGEMPVFEGNERFIWPTIQAQIDRDIAAYEKKCAKNRANGAKGGRPKNQSVSGESERFSEEPKKAKEKKNKKENENKKEIEKEEMYIAVVSYLNEKAGTNYKHTTAKTRTAIHARLEEGFTLDDFKTVIDKKCADWLCDEKMEKYLRPETLFGTKFEGYLNAKHTERNDNDGFNAKDTSDSAKRRIGNYI